VPVTSVAHDGAYSQANSGAMVQAGDGVKTDAKGRASIQLPDGTLTRLASDTEITLTSAHFAKDGNLRDVSIAEKVGRTFTNVQQPGDPFGTELAASDATSQGTTPGTEQDFIGPPLHNGEQQHYAYSFAGGGLVKAALGYPGSAMKLDVKAPDGQIYSKFGASPIVVTINHGPAGIYTILVTGVSGLGVNGEAPFVSVAALEPCTSANLMLTRDVRRGLTS